MTRSDIVRESRDAVKAAEAKGIVADNMDYRKALMARVHSGEITLEQAQTELKQVKNGAAAKGQITRNQAYCGY